MFRPRMAVVLTLILLVAGSGWMLVGEVRPFFLRPSQEKGYYGDFAATAEMTGLSTYSRHVVMRDCYQGLDRIGRTGAVTPEKYAFMDRCRALARVAVADAPSFSLGWLTGAHAAIGRLDAPDFNALLARAFQTASHEQWLAEKRAELSENNYGWLDAGNRKRHEADLTLLARSPVGSVFLANRYRLDPGFRERVVALVERLPQADQKRFLWNVQRLQSAD